MGVILSSDYEQVMQNVNRAEELAGEAEREGERRREEVRQAAGRVEEAVVALEEASQLTTQALEVSRGHSVAHSITPCYSWL